MSDAPDIAQPPERELPTLDGWRGVAILLVLLDHGGDSILRLLASVFDPTHQFVAEHYTFIKDPIGRGGVHLFFALSGYLITYRLLQEQARTGSINLRAFYLRRLFRIQPAAICFLVVVLALGLSGLVPLSLPGWASALLATANFTMPYQTWYTTHFWSLAVEEHFYLLWPALVIVLAARWRFGVAFGLALAVAAWWVIVLAWHVTQSPYMWVRTDIEALWLLSGCVAALAERTYPWRRVLDALARPGVSLMAVPLAISSIILIYTSLDWHIELLATFLCAAATPMLFIGTSRRPHSALSRVLTFAPIAWIGRISYGIYLWQQLFFVWEDQRAPLLAPWQSAPWQIIATLGIAASSYYLLEKPMMRLGRRIASRMPVPSRVNDGACPCARGSPGAYTSLVVGPPKGRV